MENLTKTEKKLLYIVGYQIDGETVITFGPFATEGEAREWSEDHWGQHGDFNWAVLELYSPPKRP